ncbi:unnamed protein product [Schistosoma margrebowiei]|uniref:Uncharacterized protein n=1 Tax=Schistosoma margrebowiei TaxID=48269 RepID=A0A183LW59_9TREM|nr:unnamed protein product [Schistosoma margrebowiei]
MVVGGSRQETMNPGFVLLGTRQQGVPVISRFKVNIANENGVYPYPIFVCGLQISNQFSIKNRVIASPPLSIAAAPGLILAHGHVATHLKNTPADVFVSSDGGYTWLKLRSFHDLNTNNFNGSDRESFEARPPWKTWRHWTFHPSALDGPHHYQIANRGGLIVAVPAETLWPDVLRFSTDEGKCWHTIPLRTGQWSINESNRYQVNNNEDDSMKSQAHHDDMLDDSEESLDKIKSASVKVTDIPSPTEGQRIVFDKNTILTTTGSSSDAVPQTTTTTTTITTSNTVNASTLNNINNGTNNISHMSSTMSSPINQMHADSHHQFQTNDDKWSSSSSSSSSSQRTDEIVVFTGLVTEPGGRAMAAAVYGYGTATQRWRVAVVDFRTNGMIKRKCKYIHISTVNSSYFDEEDDLSSTTIVNQETLNKMNKRPRNYLQFVDNI